LFFIIVGVELTGNAILIEHRIESALVNATKIDHAIVDYQKTFSESTNRRKEESCADKRRKTEKLGKSA
jgi:hypothetical protein